MSADAELIERLRSMSCYDYAAARQAADRLAALIAEWDALVDALASVQPFVPLGYAPTGRYGGADDRNAALDLARGKMELALNRAALSSTPEKIPLTATGRLLCSDCPSSDYPTDRTRCDQCPRRAAISPTPAKEAGS